MQNVPAELELHVRLKTKTQFLPQTYEISIWIFILSRGFMSNKVEKDLDNFAKISWVFLFVSLAIIGYNAI